MITTVQHPTSVKLTHTLAKEFAEMEPAPHDRPIVNRRIVGLQKMVKTGEFRTCEWARAWCEETQKEYRVNGKHTSTMFYAMNGEMPKDIKVVLSAYKCDTLEDVAKLYAKFDTRASVRTANDINRVYQSSNPDLSEVPFRIFSAAVTGISFATWEVSYAGHPADDRAELAISHSDFIVWLSGIVNDHINCNLKRGPVISAMFKTWQKSQKDATIFWIAVRDQTGSPSSSPDRVLSRFLDRTTVNNGRGATAGKQRAGQREMYVKCLHAWNAWRKGEPTDLKYYANAKTPAAV